MIQDIEKFKSLLGSNKAELIHGDEKYQLEIESQPDCSKNCPTGINVKTYVNLISNRRYEDALELIREANPFPGICGRVCTHPCEANCKRLEIDDGISVKALKRFVADFEISRSSGLREPIPVRYKERIAIIGSGPAGLTTAYDLVNLGYSVTIFEAMEKAGGMLEWGIPEFRLPREILKREIEIILSSGVKLATNKKIENPQNLLLKGYDSVVISTGAWQGIPLKINGNNLDGIIDCLEFLKKIHQKKLKQINGKVIVIGGGNSAFDSARTALRLGAEKVTIAYRRTENEMPADVYEIQEAKNEGIEIIFLSIPKRIIGNERVEGIEFLKAKLGEEDQTGRRKPIPIDGSEFILDCDLIIPAIGMIPDLTGFDGISTDKKGLIKVNTEFQTSIEKIYAVGDVVRGPSTIVDVIGDAHLCSSSVHCVLQGMTPIGEKKLMNDSLKVVDINNLIEKKEKEKVVVSPPLIRKNNFKEVELTYSELAALKESSRCLQCGPCFECQTCTPTCVYKQVVAQFEGEEFLVKFPCDLSKEIHNNDVNEWQLKVGNKNKKIKFNSLTPKIDKNLCIACGRCEEACAYRAIRIKLKIGGIAYSSVEHDICRSCGRCVFVCPTGAVSLNLYSDSTLKESIVNSIKKNDGIAVFGCYWSVNKKYEKFTTMELMCAVGVTHAMIIQALSYGAKGVLILYCGSTHEHYFDINYDVEDIIKDTKDLLKIVGLNPNRIFVSKFSESSFQTILDCFKLSLDKEKLKCYKPVEKEKKIFGRIAKELFQLRELTKQNGKVISNSLYLKGKVLKTAGLPHTLDMLNNMDKLAKMFEVELDIKNLDESKNQSELFSLLNKIVNNNQNFVFKETNIKIGIHKTPDDKLYKPIKDIIQILPGVELVELENMDCGSSEWCFPDALSREKAIKVFKEAEEKQIDLIITTTSDCLTHLRTCNRENAWKYSSVEVKDIFSFLAEIIMRGEE